MNILNMFAVGIPLAVGLGYILFFVWLNAPLVHKTSGDWVADIWLTTNQGVGATMYRQRFDSKLMASLTCKARALGLDMILPTSYWVEDEHGKPSSRAYHFGIQSTVRCLGPLETQFFQPTWKTELPNEFMFRAARVNLRKDPADLAF
jgi:hypothetical protein